MKTVFRHSIFAITMTTFLLLIGESDSGDPFTGNVSVEEGENVVDWESAIFGSITEKKEKGVDNDIPEDEKEEKIVVEKNDGTLDSEDVSGRKDLASKDEATATDDIVNEDKIDAPEIKVVAEPQTHTKWGEYYGPTPKFEDAKQKDKKSVQQNEKKDQSNQLSEKNDGVMFPLDVIIYSQGGDNYVPMINAGLKLSYWNIYSTVSIGTDFSGALARPMGLNMFVGGFYRFWDISVNAALGYEKVWDFSEKGDFENYSLGFKTGLNYHMLSWMSVTAGAGVNYCIMKEVPFEEGKFVPMIFGGFEFSLIK
jgi:hypothetical protein